METNENISPNAAAGKHVVVVGLGNIGSPLVELLARLEFVNRLTLVDHDAYDESNLRGQAVLPSDVGRPKVLVQAERAGQINPALQVEAIHAAVEDVPLARLRADVIAACVDSKWGRQHVSQPAWRLNVPWVDAGVAAEGRLARVNVYLPGDDQPCYECAWSKRDYETMEVKQPCQPHGSAAPTHAPASLGSLAASLQAIEVEKILSGDLKSAAVGKQITLAAGSHQLHSMSFRRNPKCKFDHRTFQLQPVRCEPGNFPLRELFAAVQKEIDGAEEVRLHLDGKPFERQWRCVCGAEQAVLALAGRTAAKDRACRRCNGTMQPVGFVSLPSLCERTLTPPELAKPLSELGLVAGDVIFTNRENSRIAFELVNT
ncbi:MAG: hypothetical protein EXS35_03345 [Pedosphaera sp.]|nr:hypothetical protein [Pedosphaera sp.]